MNTSEIGDTAYILTCQNCACEVTLYNMDGPEAALEAALERGCMVTEDHQLLCGRCGKKHITNQQQELEDEALALAA